MTFKPEGHCTEYSRNAFHVCLGYRGATLIMRMKVTLFCGGGGHEILSYLSGTLLMAFLYCSKLIHI
jgi:hypothetical protein